MVRPERSLRPALLPASLILSVVCATAIAGEADPGAWIFERKCAVCHGLEGLGDGPMANSLRPPPSNLRLLARRHGGDFPAGYVYQVIDGRIAVSGHGSREMPIWGEYFTAEALLPPTREPGIEVDEMVHDRIMALVRHVRSLQQR